MLKILWQILQQIHCQHALTFLYYLRAHQQQEEARQLQIMFGTLEMDSPEQEQVYHTVMHRRGLGYGALFRVLGKSEELRCMKVRIRGAFAPEVVK